GRWDQAVSVALEAATEAESRLGPGEAVELLERVLPHVNDELERARTLCRIGADYLADGKPAKGERYLAEGLARLDRAGSQAAARAMPGTRCLTPSKPRVTTIGRAGPSPSCHCTTRAVHGRGTRSVRRSAKHTSP